MTSRRFSDKHKGSAYTFFSAIRTGLLPAIVEAVFLMVLMVVTPFGQLANYDDSFKKGLSSSSAKQIFKFLVFGGDGDATFVTLGSMLLAVCSACLAIMIFRFISDKRTVNVYYSLGIKRSALFCSSYFAGLSLLLFIPAVACTLSFIVNIIFLKLSWQLSLVLLAWYLAITSFTTVCYSLTGAVFSSVGTVFEGMIFSAGILALPSVVFKAMDILKNALAEVVDARYISINSFSGDYIYYQTGIFEANYRYNPLFFFNEMSAYAAGRLNDNGKLVHNDGSEWVMPQFAHFFLWIAVATALFFVGLYFFRKRKAENCGFLNTNKPLSFIVLFEVCFAAVCFVFNDYNANDKQTYFIFAAIALAVVYVIYEIATKRNVKLILRTAYKLPVCYLLVGAILLSYMTGIAGGTKIPDATDIKSVEVSAPAGTSVLKAGCDEDYYGFYLSYEGLYGCNYDSSFALFPAVTDADDIKQIVSINEKLSEQFVESSAPSVKLTFRYTLKNGRERIIYTGAQSDETLDIALQLYNLKSYSEYLKTLMTTSVPENEVKDLFMESPFKYFQSWLGSKRFDVTIIAEDLLTYTSLNLTQQRKEQLLTAVYKDLSAHPLSDIFTYTGTQYGVIRFSPSVRFMEEKTAFTTDTYNEYKASATDAEPSPDEPEYYTQEDDFTGYGDLLSNYSSFDFVVNDRSVNTLGLLNEWGYGKAFATSAKRQIVAVGFSEAKLPFWFGSERNVSYNFYPWSGTVTAFERDQLGYDSENTYKNDKTSLSNVSENIIEDKELIKQAEAVALTRGFTYGKGYCMMTLYSDGTSNIKFIPEDKAPSFVSNFNYEKFSYDTGEYATDGILF